MQDDHSDADSDHLGSSSRRGPTRGSPTSASLRNPAPERSRSAADEPPARSEAPEPTRSGGPLGPVLSARPATSAASTVMRGPKFDALADDEAAPASTPRRDGAPTPQPAATLASSSHATPEPAATPLQQAAQALTSVAAETDWWTLKLHADRKMMPEGRVAAYRQALERFPDQPELLRGLACELSLTVARGEGRELYRRLEALTPDDPQVHLDLAVLYVHWGAGRTQAEPRAVRAWQLALTRPEPAMLAAVAFVRGLLARHQNRDDTPALRVLAGLLPITAGPIMALASVLARIVHTWLDTASIQIYHRLLLCLRGEADPQTLQAIPRWTELTALAPEHAWPDDPPVLEDSLEADRESD